MSFPVQVFPYKIICETELLSYRVDTVLECKHSARVDVYLCLAYVSPSENNFIDSYGNV